MDCSAVTNLTRLRFTYLQYRQWIQQKGTIHAASATNQTLQHLAQECQNYLHAVLQEVDETTNINPMAVNKQNVILPGNSPICCNQGVIGVMIPFYASDSFLHEELVDKISSGNKQASSITLFFEQLQQVAEGLRSEEEQRAIDLKLSQCVSQFSDEKEWATQWK